MQTAGRSVCTVCGGCERRGVRIHKQAGGRVVHEFQRISQRFFRTHACTMLTCIIFRYAMPSLMPIYLRRIDGGFKRGRRYRPRRGPITVDRQQPCRDTSQESIGDTYRSDISSNFPSNRSSFPCCAWWRRGRDGDCTAEKTNACRRRTCMGEAPREHQAGTCNASLVYVPCVVRKSAARAHTRRSPQGIRICRAMADCKPSACVCYAQRRQCCAYMHSYRAAHHV
jgi:hypothetical protein